MNTVFAPAVALLNKMRYPVKFGLVGAISFLIMLALLVQLAGSLKTSLTSTENELDAIGRVPKVMLLIQLTQQHRGLSSAVLSGNEAMGPALAKKTEELVGAMKQADDALSVLVEAEHRQRWQEAKGAWESLRSGGSAMKAADNIAAHTRLIAQQIVVLHDLGDAGELALDSSADSYYLLDNIIRRIPTVAERVGRLRALGTGALAAKAMDEQRRFDISAQMGDLHTALADMKENFARVAALDPRLKPSLDRFAGELETETGKIVDQLRNHVLKDDFEMPSATYLEMTTSVINMVYARTFTELLPETERLLAERAKVLKQRFLTNIVVAVSVMLVLVYIGIGMYLSVLGSVRELREGAAGLAAGNLGSRIRFSASDELKEVATQFNEMGQSFSDVIRRVQSSAHEVSRSAISLAESAAEVSRGSEAQSEAASSMAAAVEEMTVGVDEIANSAAAAEGASSESGRLSADGGVVVAQTVSEMKLIAGTVNDTAKVIRELGEQSAHISMMVNSIKEIADQTNLLALNAAIEAARAGETGRGFAVVADEVRKLAERTGKATDEITAMVASIQGGTTRAVGTMEAGVKRVESGVQLATKAGSSMELLSRGAGDVALAVADISSALREQGAASTEIARSVERIAQMAERNSAAVRDTAGTARELQTLAHQLQGEVERFRI